MHVYITPIADLVLSLLLYHYYHLVLSTSAGPSSPPRQVDVEVLGASFAEVTWQAPPLEHQNGHILTYIIRYFPTNDPSKMEDIFKTVLFNDDEADLYRMLTDLVPFTRYSFQVSAVNAAGASPFSTAVDGITKEDGKGSCNHSIFL